MAVFNCLASSGAIIYSPDGNYGTDGSGGGYGGGGGMGGGGSVWSDSAQLIWISVNDAPKYPVWLKPGWNEVHFWIPFIFPDDEWIEAPLIIEAPGYILIPAGFEFNIKTDEDAPVQTGNPKMTDKLKFIDVYDVEIQEVPVPVNLDGIIDELVFEDTHSIDIINTTLLAEQTIIDNINLEDVNQVEIEEYQEPEEPYDGEAKRLESIKLEDINTYNLINITIRDEQEQGQSTEELGISDFINIELE